MVKIMNKILIIDDQKPIRNALREILEYEKYVVDDASDGLMGLKMIKSHKYDLVFCDIKMPQLDGIEFLKKISEMRFSNPIIMISGHGDIETAVQTLKLGAYDYIEKPLDLNRVLTSVKNTFDNSLLKKENIALKNKINNSSNNEIIGNSKQIKSIKKLILKVANTNARILITGSNGTGKELVAKQIHEKSNRNNQSFIEVNCAAIPSELIESELFGHVKGAFTSAVKDKAGKFEAANGGTIFLDEIGDMSMSAQSKVLRALQENKIQRVGSERDLIVDVRVIAATNKNLRKEIQENNFREDLFHRLAVIEIDVPSLNKRLSDIPLLVEHFLKDISKSSDHQLKTIDKDAVDQLKKYNWTGNVRELRNVIERLIILSDGKKISKKDVIKYSNK